MDANPRGVFVYLPEKAVQFLPREGWVFYTFIGSGFARFMCSWDTRPEEVDALVEAMIRALQP